MMEDCFAYKRNSCTALKVKQCEGCSFYKSKVQYRLDQKKALARIYTLDADQRDDIIKTYYGGQLEVE
ncbi:hypothetical protein M3212_09665 [Alkalihalobacillus oceani]|uniref:hypothetical protein n=1 Tax=Halalkalibacter oceani TaxID=1653776 RepID=UPI00203E9943|nr:hypothetical protein [Halalkalibacter oceani]MCM3761051.1 hypothetical protein [Halalkalibacter oceani]